MHLRGWSCELAIIIFIFVFRRRCVFILFLRFVFQIKFFLHIFVVFQRYPFGIPGKKAVIILQRFFVSPSRHIHGIITIWFVAAVRETNCFNILRAIHAVFQCYNGNVILVPAFIVSRVNANGFNCRL
uniref:Uncharacterized protein n=1 Tax=Ixodes ricinus TaxID=34613 RepID=A0A6B0UQJ2_IXORI